MAGLVQTIFKSIPAMANIFLMFSFFILVFGIIGMQLFGGDFQHQCVSISDSDVIYSLETGHYFCDPTPTAAQAHLICPDGYICSKIGNPDYGLSNYDSMPYAMQKTFELITLEGWSGFMYQCRDYYNSYFYDIYCYATVLLGAFVILNLMVAVQSNQLSEVLDQVEETRKKAEEQRRQEMLEHCQMD